MRTINNRQRTILLVVLLFGTQFIGLLMIANCQQQILDEYETPEIVSNLQGAEYTWEVTRSMGIFSTYDIHSGDQIRYRVKEANINLSNYVVDVAYNNWTDTRFFFSPDPQNASFYLIPRDWGVLMIDTIIPDISPYFARHPKMIELYREAKPGILSEDLTGQELLNQFNENPNFWETNLGIDIYEFTLFELNKYEHVNFQYRTIWYQSRMITIIDMSIELDEQNYERLTYTRAEGILLSRETSVNIINGTRKDHQGLTRDFAFPLSGSFSVELTEFDREFIVSFWHYVIWFAIIFGGIIAIIIIISIVLASKERKYRTMDY